MSDRVMSPSEIARRMDEFDRRQTAQDRLASERHAENRESMREISGVLREQVTATNGLTEKIAVQNGRVTKLEFGCREIIRDATQLQQSVSAMQRTATEAATTGATQAIYDTAPSRKQLNATTAKWTGITAGAITGLGYAAKIVLEALHWIS